MNGNPYPTGTLLTDSFPIERRNNGYGLRSYGDPDYKIFVRDYPRKIEPLFRRALNESSYLNVDTNIVVYMPTVHDGRPQGEHSDHCGRLLIPPKIDQKSELFFQGLVVPDMQLHDEVRRDGSLRGFILLSEYLGNQQLFTSQRKNIGDSPNTRYLGWIFEVGRRRIPVVNIAISTDINETVFRENESKLELILNSSSRFWWNMG